MINLVKKIKISYYIWKWLSLSVLALAVQSVAVFFIMQADFLADNINLLLDDPYIYWILGWILFVPSLVFFAISFIKFFKLLLQYFKNLHNKNAGSEE